MNWTELGPGIILILLGLTLFLPALLGTGRRKYIEIPLIKVSFAAPNTPGKKIALGSFGLVVFAIGTYLLVAPLQTKEVNPPPSMETPAPNVTSTESSVSLAGTSVSTPTFTPVPLPSETSTQPPTFSVASTPAPTLTPAQALTATPFLDIESGCISSSLWAPFEGQLLTTDDANCWQLIDWGIVPQDGGLSISMGRTSTISHGIYRKIPDNTTVAFRFRIDQMQTVDGLEPRLMFGIIPLSPARPSDGKYLLLQRESVGQEEIFVKLRNPSTSTSDQFLPVRYSAGETHDVAFVIDNISTTLYLDKEKVAGPISSLFSQKAFWIGYDLPPQTSVQAFIFDISFDEQ